MKKFLGLFLAASLVLVLAACGKKDNKEKVLVVGYDPFSAKFSPFFADTAYDQDVVSMTSLGLMTTDRDGGIVYNAIDGETVSRGGVDHFYSGLSDLSVAYDEATDKTKYTIEIRNDVKFSDGHVLDADDIIFSYYVLLDPNYDGSSTLGSVNIVGLKNYQNNSSYGDAAELLTSGIATLVGKTDAELEALTATEIAAQFDTPDGTTLTVAQLKVLRDAMNVKAQEAMEYTIGLDHAWVKDSVITNTGYKSYWRVIEDGKVVKFDEEKHEASDLSVEATLALFYRIDDSQERYMVDVNAAVDTMIAATDFDWSATIMNDFYKSFWQVEVVDVTVGAVTTTVLYDSATHDADDVYTMSYAAYKKDNATSTKADVSVRESLIALYVDVNPKVASDYPLYSVVDASGAAKTKAVVIKELAEEHELNYKAIDSTYGSGVSAGMISDAAFDLALDWIEENADDETTVPNVTGINKVSSTKVEVTVHGFDAAAIYQVAGLTVSPLHYYGKEADYNYAQNKFGFASRTDAAMDVIKTKTATPLGAGPYKFVEFKDNVVRFEANPNYYKGEPKIKYINFQVVDEANKISAIGIGDIDISNPTGSKTKFEEIKTYGSKIFTSSIDNLGYGYIGINAKNVSVGDSLDSAESKALRTAFATVISSQRYVAINSYYGEAASVINYPISNTSWAAPKAGEAGYEYAFSKNPDGTPIYGADVDPSSLSQSDRTAKAKAAAKQWLIIAGYKFGTDNTGAKITEAPTGAKTNYEFIIPAGGAGEHPAFAIVTAFANVMAELGMTINVNDPADSNVLWDALDALEQEMWAAAWGSTIDPDMYQVYHSKNVIGETGSTGSNHYYIRSTTLDGLIMTARESSDQDFRKGQYKLALEEIMSWAVEVPTYQRQNIITISAQRVDIDTLTADITTYWGWMMEIEKLEMK